MTRAVAGDRGIVVWGGHVQGGPHFVRQTGKPTVTQPAPTIQINALNPSSATRSTTLQVAVLGVNLLPGDKIVWDGGEVGTSWIYSGQITTDPVTLGATPRAVPVHVRRGSDVTSNELTFTIT
jgi:hypothetical protein